MYSNYDLTRGYSGIHPGRTPAHLNNAILFEKTDPLILLLTALNCFENFN